MKIKIEKPIEAVINHRKQEEKVLNDLNRLIDECFAGKLSRAVVERLIEAMEMSLKIRMQETRMLQEAYLQGFKDGVRWMINNRNNIEDEE